MQVSEKNKLIGSDFLYDGSATQYSKFSAMLNKISPDIGYKKWLKVIWSVKYLYTHLNWKEEVVLKMLIDWSKTSQKYKWDKKNSTNFNNIWCRDVNKLDIRAFFTIYHQSKLCEDIYKTAKDNKNVFKKTSKKQNKALYDLLFYYYQKKNYCGISGHKSNFEQNIGKLASLELLEMTQLLEEHNPRYEKATPRSLSKFFHNFNSVSKSRKDYVYFNNKNGQQDQKRCYLIKNLYSFYHEIEEKFNLKETKVKDNIIDFKHSSDMSHLMAKIDAYTNDPKNQIKPIKEPDVPSELITSNNQKNYYSDKEIDKIKIDAFQKGVDYIKSQFFGDVNKNN
jgi:adenylate kinase family enzyme